VSCFQANSRCPNRPPVYERVQERLVNDEGNHCRVVVRRRLARKEPTGCGVSPLRVLILSLPQHGAANLSSTLLHICGTFLTQRGTSARPRKCIVRTLVVRVICTLHTRRNRLTKLNKNHL